VSAADIRKVARDSFGWDQLRPGQLEAIEAVLGGRDTLAVMATGHGKSAIYQIAGLLLDGPTVVVSPLIALQRDQVADLDHEALGGAAAVSSAESAARREEALEEIGRDELEYLFLAPEQLANPDVLARVREAKPSLFVVDEAHCISEWGHDFRPDYLRLGAAAAAVGRPPILALTATASPPVRSEIVQRLDLHEPFVAVRGFDRPNIRLEVDRFHRERDKRDALVERVAAGPKPGIVYVATRKRAEELEAVLGEAGVGAVAYHGGMAAGRRRETQERFMGDEIDVIVATTAFGMGIDKPNVRWVIHYEVADSVDSYWQEVGRAGRDGEPATGLLLYRPEDLGLRQFFAGAGQVDHDQLELVALALTAHGGPTDPADLRDEIGLSESKLTTAVSRLEEAGAVEVEPDGAITIRGREIGEEAVDRATEAQEDRESYDRSRVEMMRAYAEAQEGCRRAFVLTYFGEQEPEPCGNCDICEAGRGAVEVDDEPFPVGARVAHVKWGQGMIQRYEPGEVVVLFDEAGYKTLDLESVNERSLLEPA
jgi:ATP-dependent DNA helicase RecQ